MSKNDVEIEIQYNYLIISAKIQSQKEEKDKNWIRAEFVSHSFYRVFELPSNADTETIEVKMKNGRLDIKVGKKKTRIASTVIHVK